MVERIAHRHGIRLLLRNAGECGADNYRVLAVLMTKCRDQHRRIVAGNIKQWRFRTRQRGVLDWRSAGLHGGVLLVRVRAGERSITNTMVTLIGSISCRPALVSL